MSKEKQTVGAADVATLDAALAANPHGNVSQEGDKVVVSASAQMSSSGVLGPKSDRAQRIERAMSDAVLLALDEGHSIEDSATILAYKRYARARLLRDLGEPIEVPDRPAPKANDA